MKTKLLMIFFLLLGIGISLYTLLISTNSDYLVQVNFRSLGLLQMSLFWITLLYYSYKQGASIKLILFTFLFPIGYFVITGTINGVLIWRFDDDVFHYYMYMTSIIKSTIIIYLVSRILKYYKSVIFIPVVAFDVVYIGINMGRLFGFSISRTNSIMLFIIECFVVIAFVFYDIKLSREKLIQSKD